MPAAAPLTSTATAARLIALGGRIRQHRETLRISAAAAAEAAGLSRVTLHRIERGEASVTMGAWLNVLDALGMALDVRPMPAPAAERVPAAASETKPVARLAKRRKPSPQATVSVADYPQLRRLAWPLAGATVLTAQEALSLYERNWRHVDTAAMEPRERALLDRLVADVGQGQLLV